MWPFKVRALPAEVVQEASKYQDYSPDIVKLEQKEFQYVFIYGRNMRGHPDESIMLELPGSDLCVHSVFTEDANFILWRAKKGMGSFPIPLRGSRRDCELNKCTNIKGQLWKVRSQMLFELDKYQQNTILFERQMVNLIIPQRVVVQDKDTRRILVQSFHVVGWSAWMYLGVPDIWKEHIDVGFKYEPCTRYQEMKRYAPKEPLFDTYYYFGLAEYYEPHN